MKSSEKFRKVPKTYKLQNFLHLTQKCESSESSEFRMHLILTKHHGQIDKCSETNWVLRNQKCSETSKKSCFTRNNFFYSSCSPWLVMSENPNLLSRKELSDLYLYIYAYQICFDLMIRTQCVCFLCLPLSIKNWPQVELWIEFDMKLGCWLSFSTRKFQGSKFPLFCPPCLVGV